MSNQTIRTDVAAQKIAATLAAGKSVSAACRAARIARSSYYLWFDEDPEFAALVQDAIEDGTDKLEDSSVRQALDGNTTLMVLMLKARRPDKFKDRSENQLTGPGGSPLTVTFSQREDGPA